MTVNEEQFKTILKRLDSIESTMDIRFKEWSDDRKDIQEIKVELATVRAIAAGSRDDSHEANKKVVNKMDEKLGEMPNLVEAVVKDALEESKKKK